MSSPKFERGAQALPNSLSESFKHINAWIGRPVPHDLSADHDIGEWTRYVKAQDGVRPRAVAMGSLIQACLAYGAIDAQIRAAALSAAPLEIEAQHKAAYSHIQAAAIALRIAADKYKVARQPDDAEGLYHIGAMQDAIAQIEDKTKGAPDHFMWGEYKKHFAQIVESPVFEPFMNMVHARIAFPSPPSADLNVQSLSDGASADSATMRRFDPMDEDQSLGAPTGEEDQSRGAPTGDEPQI